MSRCHCSNYNYWFPAYFMWTHVVQWFRLWQTFHVEIFPETHSEKIFEGTPSTLRWIIPKDFRSVMYHWMIESFLRLSSSNKLLTDSSNTAEFWCDILKKHRCFHCRCEYESLFSYCIRAIFSDFTSDLDKFLFELHIVESPIERFIFRYGLVDLNGVKPRPALSSICPMLEMIHVCKCRVPLRSKFGKAGVTVYPSQHAMSQRHRYLLLKREANHELCLN